MTDPHIGYSALDRFEECFEYNENECYVADSARSLRAFLTGANLDVNDYAVVSVRMSDILADYGVSGGRFCMELVALKRFRRAADARGIAYSLEQYDDGAVNVELDRSTEE